MRAGIRRHAKAQLRDVSRTNFVLATLNLLSKGSPKLRLLLPQTLLLLGQRTTKLAFLLLPLGSPQFLFLRKTREGKLSL